MIDRPARFAPSRDCLVHGGVVRLAMDGSGGIRPDHPAGPRATAVPA